MSMEEKTPEFDFSPASKKSGEDNNEDDIFKSAIHSPDVEPTALPGSDEIDLNDDEEDAADTLLQNTQKNNVENTATLNQHDEDDSSLFKSTLDKSFHNKGVSQADSQNETPSTNSKPYQQADSTSNNGEQVQSQSSSKPEVNNAGATQSQQEAATLSSEVSGVTKPVDGTRNEKAAARFDGNDTNEADGQYLEISVTEPQKQGDGMSGFMVYRVTTHTNIALFRRKEFAVWRRFSDFLGLYQKLAEKYLRKGRIVPPAPEKNVMGTTKIKISGQGDPSSSHQSEFVEKRRSTLERFMNKIAIHSILRVDPDFRDFLEIDSDLPKSTSTSAFSGAGVVRLFSKFGDTVNKISYKMDESDPWFEEKIQNIEALETQLRKVHGSIELLVLNRRELAHSTGVFAKSAAILSNQEEHTALARALAQLAEVEEKVEQVHNEQGNADFYLFSELLKDYIGLIGAVKDIFHERVKAFQTWQHAQQTLNKKRETKARLELQVRNDKIGQAREEVVEWEAKVEKSHEEFVSISNVIKKELEQFELARVKDFKKIIVKYLESLLAQQQELVKYWEAFLPEAQAIA